MSKYLLLFILFVTACNPNQDLIEGLEKIKIIGNDNPVLAMSQLDSMAPVVVDEPTYVRMKYDLLRIRLQDKANIMPESDKPIKILLNFFNDDENVRDRQEVLYYAGSIYRDLGDIPSALNYFLKSMSIAKQAGSSCDSIMLRNTYSNLSYLFNLAEDNQNFLLYARKEYEIAKSLGSVTDICRMHLGDAWLACDSTSEALMFYEQVLSNQMKSTEDDIVSGLLYKYSYLMNSDRADTCAMLLANDSATIIDDFNPQKLLAWGEYHQLKRKYSNAIDCYQQILDNDFDLTYKYDASRLLAGIYREQGNQEMVLHYSNLFIEISGELNLGKRQELAATVNNLYRYNRDKEEEERIQNENLAYKEKMKQMVFIIILGISFCALAFVYHRYRQMKMILSLQKQIKGIAKEKNALNLELFTQQEELQDTKKELYKINNEVTEAKRKLAETSAETQRLQEELKTKECILKEKIEQNKTIVSLMHQTEFEVNAEEIIRSLKKSGDGIRQMSEKEWNQLYAAADRLWPDFKKLMCDTLGTVTDEQRQVCYLMRAGFNKTEIQNMTSLSRTTVWRWTKKYEWIYSIIK